jgi:phenylalanyl-tRNA synthetase alpha chain
MAESDSVHSFETGLAQVREQFAGALRDASDEPTLRSVNARFVGPQGELTKLLKLMPKLPGDRRRELGQAANALKQEIQETFDESLERIFRRAREAELSGKPIDVTLPGRWQASGRLHPITRIRRELIDIFGSLGFEVADGPEVDLYENCFDKLGFPPDHPATDEHDTFFIDAGGVAGPHEVLLRTHTSTIQIREMMRRKPPMAIMAPGAVYRRDDDATHSPMFSQLEGFLVDEDVSFAELKGVLTLFAKRLFDEQITVRFRTSYFPFVEPGGEVDISCVFCRSWEKDEARTAACRVCKGTGWLEILGCGMIHPVVFEHVGYDPEKYTGFAFGMGLDRIAMLKYGIPNIKLLYENDVRFLGQF